MEILLKKITALLLAITMITACSTLRTETKTDLDKSESNYEKSHLVEGDKIMTLLGYTLMFPIVYYLAKKPEGSE